MGKPLISLKLIELVRSSRCAGSYEQEVEPRAESFSLGLAGEDGAPNSNFSKLLELSEMIQARKLIFGLQVNIDRANSRRYVGGT